MNKIIIGFIAAIFLLSTYSGGLDILGAQEKDKQKEKDAKAKGVIISGDRGGVIGGVGGGIQGGVPGRIKGGVPGGIGGGVMSAYVDEDFLLQPRKIITFEVEHLLLKPTETISLNKMMPIKTESGLKFNYHYNPPAGTKDEVGLEITPTIVENKGIELQVAILHNRKPVKQAKILSRNYEPVLVELMENKDDHSKLVDKITPLIQVLYPPQNYPQALDKLDMVGYVLIMNDTLLINSTRGGVLSSGGGSPAEPEYLYFWVRGKGAYVLSLWPFEGAEPIGVVSDNAIRIKHGKDFFVWLSMKPILPEGKWRVWVRNNPDYDPFLTWPGAYKNLSPQDREWIRASYQKENAAEAGVFGGRKMLERYFMKK